MREKDGSAWRKGLSALLLGSGIGITAALGTALAQDETASSGDEGPIHLDTLVVTASGQANTLRDAPASISVVTRDEIERMAARDVTDLLGRIEGVQLQRSGNLRTVRIRGLPSRYSLMLINGRRVDSNPNLFRGNDFDTAWVPVESIERIEVVRGPMSSLYGSDAIGGVVNIITRDIGDYWSGSITGETILQENRDAGDFYRTGFEASGPLIQDVLGVKINGSYDHRASDDDDINPGVDNAGNPLPGFTERSNAFLNTGLEWSVAEDHDLTLDYGFSNREHWDVTLRRHSLALGHKGRFSFGESEIRLYGDAIENKDGNISGEKHPNDAYNATLDGKLTIPWTEWRHVLTIGGESRYQKLDDETTLAGLPGTANFGKDTTADVTQHALFIEDEIALLDNFKVTGGARFDYHEEFGSHVSPRVYAVYHPVDEVTLRAGYSQAFKAPTLLELSPNWGSVSCGSPTTGCYIIGNPDLEPETSSSFEIGARYDNDWLGAGVTFFRNNLEDMITIQNRTANAGLAPTLPNFVGYLPDGRPIFAYENLDKVSTQGIEVGAELYLGEDWTVRGNYTYLDADNESGPQAIPLIYSPKHSANLSVDWWALDDVMLSFNATYVGDQYTFVSANGAVTNDADGYAMFDIGAVWHVNDRFTLRAGVLNFLDKTVEREIPNDFNEEGRRYFISGTIRF